HWQQQAVTITDLSPRQAPLARPPRAARAHGRLAWDERFSRNACAPLHLATMPVAGVPQVLVAVLSEGDQPATPYAAMHPLVAFGEGHARLLGAQQGVVLSAYTRAMIDLRVERSLFMLMRGGRIQSGCRCPTRRHSAPCSCSKLVAHLVG